MHLARSVRLKNGVAVVKRPIDGVPLGKADADVGTGVPCRLRKPLKPFLESSAKWPVVGATVFRFAGIAPITAEIYLSANPRFQSRYSPSEISPESRLARIAAHALTAASSYWASASRCCGLGARRPSS